MECKDCIELLFGYCDDELDVSLKKQVDEHLGTCSSCQNELDGRSYAMSFFKVNMPVVTVDPSFTEQVMYKIDLSEVNATFIKPMEGIGLVLVILTLGMLILVGPTIISLLMLIGNILLGLLSTAAVVFAVFPLIQIISIIILGAVLFLVTIYMRNMVLHDFV